MQAQTVVVALAPEEVAGAVVDFLDRSGGARVVGSSAEVAELARLVRSARPDVLVGAPRLVGRLGSLEGTHYVAVDTAETIGSLGAAIRAGAEGFVLWPRDRTELLSAVGRARASTPRGAGTEKGRALVVAVVGARGGAGASFVSTHLAAALVPTAPRTVLLDADPVAPDLAVALGAVRDPSARTVADLAPVMDELDTEHIDEVLWTHPAGFRAMLAPADPWAASGPVAERMGRLASELAARSDALVLHAGRGLDDRIGRVFETADRIAVVTALDVASVHGARRVLGILSGHGLDARADIVVNRAGRSEVTAADLARALDRPVLASIPVDRAVPASQDRGRLVGPRSRTFRAMKALGRRLMEPREMAVQAVAS